MDGLQAYNILIECVRSENRILAERLSLLIIANSVLMLAFFMAVQTIYFCWMRYALPIVGIMLSIGFAVALWVGANAAIKGHDALCKLEEEPELAYMKDRQIRPCTDIGGMIPKRMHIWKLGYRISPFFCLPVIVIWLWCICMAPPYA